MDLQLPDGAKVPEKLLRMALTHSSYAREHRRVRDNERLEFLGDVVVSLAYSQYLYLKYPSMSEGELTLARARAVNTTALAEQARALGLGLQLRLGRGEAKSGGRDRESLLADAFEALVGAIFLGCGWDVACQFVVDHLSGSERGTVKDSKTQLQELLQASSRQAPVYEVKVESGPDHAKLFTVQVSHQDKVLGLGKGRSKKEAEQHAAKHALSLLQSQQETP